MSTSLVIPTTKPIGTHFAPSGAPSPIYPPVQYPASRFAPIFAPPTSYSMPFPGLSSSEEPQGVREELEMMRNHIRQAIGISDYSTKLLHKQMEMFNGSIQLLEKFNLSNQLKDNHILALQNRIDELTQKLRVKNEPGNRASLTQPKASKRKRLEDLSDRKGDLLSINILHREKTRKADHATRNEQSVS